MKKSVGFLKSMSDSLSERDASSKDLFGSIYNVKKAIRDFDKLIERGPLNAKEMAELKIVEMQLYLHAQGTPEHESALKRQKELEKIICADDPSPEPAGFGKIVSEALLKLKYDLWQMTYMIVLRLLIVVVNVAVLIGLIYFLPTIIGWLF